MLPGNYNYEIQKTVLKVLQAKQAWLKNKDETHLEPYKVSLQFPEGLLIHAPVICDIVNEFCGNE